MNPRYPIYVISKGRADTCLTANELNRIGVPFSVVVEPQEVSEYERTVGKKNILVLPFSNLGRGSVPARNWVWNHSKGLGAARHWIIDDNIRTFYRYNKNGIVPVSTGAIFNASEDFIDRYKNVVMAGFEYEMFVTRRNKWKPFRMNTRIYSCILLDNKTALRWRGRYNEDTDLSLRFLKSGKCTILFLAFLADKTATMTMKGGNTDELYKQNKDFDGRLEMAKSLQRQHPDIVKIVRKWGRWQHHVDYRPFKNNKLIRRAGVTVQSGNNEYGMRLVKKQEAVA